MDNCLVKQLRKLKESSKEAVVEGLDCFSNFKVYMHISRDIQVELTDLLKQSAASKKSQLILVCGAVGYGKSHLITHLLKNEPEIMNHFRIHSDATESFDPKRTSIDTLNEVLKDFSDERLKDVEVNTKLILAINLGTLSNFINSEYQEHYQNLKSYVDDKRVLEANTKSDPYNIQSNFQAINLTDYHLFSLTSNGPKSTYIKQIFQKITQECEENPFFMTYKDYCLNSCTVAENCPVRYNYEFLREHNMQEQLIQLLAEGIIKQKLIISTRSLFNFIYDILVSNHMEQLVNEKKIDRLNKCNAVNLTKHLTPNMIFERRETSNILDALYYLDPVHIRSEKMDELLILLSIADDINILFNEHIKMDDFPFIKNKVTMFQKESKSREKIKKLFVRLYKFCPKANHTYLQDNLYQEYVKNLYYYNVGDKNQLRITFNNVKEAIYKWNGECGKNKISLILSQKQVKYKVIHHLEIKPYVRDLVEIKEEALNKFNLLITLKFKKSEEDEFIKLPIDFSLYQLLMKIRNGYKANRKDKNNFVCFVQFIDNIIALGEQDKELIFEEKLGDERHKYKLSYDEEFDQYSFERI